MKMSFAIRELVILRASQISVERADQEAAPSSSPHRLAAAVCGRIANRSIQDDVREAMTWVKEAIAIVRSSRDADPGWTDEQIARMLLEKFRSRNPQDPRVGLGIAKEKRQADPPG